MKDRHSNVTQLNPGQNGATELEEYVLFFNGTLIVRQDAVSNAQVLSYESRLKRQNSLKRKKVVDHKGFSDAKKRLQQAEEATTNSVTINEALVLFKDAYVMRASDIHIHSFETHAEVYYRIDGMMTHRHHWEGGYTKALCQTIYQSMADIADTTYKERSNQDGRIGQPEHLPAGVYGIRIASGPHAQGGSFMVMRLLYDATEGVEGAAEKRLGALGYSPLHVRTLSFLKKRPTGINIIAGPTGSGKSTTLKHVMETLASENPEHSFYTIEDPPEYPIAGALQLPVTNAESSDERAEAFSRVIRACMRSDPDIIMIGEVRDPESARLAVRAAMTGHKVWTTLHANSAFNILNRMGDLLQAQDSQDPMAILSDISVMTGLVAQQLVPVLCPRCKKPLKGNEGSVDAGLLRRLSKLMDLADSKSKVSILGDGCAKCRRGLTGRTVVAEVVATDPEMLTILRKDGIAGARKYWLAVQKGQTIIQHTLSKIREGIVDPAIAELKVGLLTTDMAFEDGILEEEELREIG